MTRNEEKILLFDVIKIKMWKLDQDGADYQKVSDFVLDMLGYNVVERKYVFKEWFGVETIEELKKLKDEGKI